MAVFSGNGSAGAPSFTFSSDTDTGMYRPAADVLGFALNGSVRFAINGNAGNLAAIFSSTSTPRTNYAGLFGSIVPAVQVEQAIGYVGVVSNYDNTTQGAPGELILGRTGATAVLSNTAVANGNWLGMISFQGADGTNLEYGARIRAIADGTIAANQMPGTMIFETTPAASATPAEVLRMTSDKYLRMASGTGGIQFNGDTAAANALDDYEQGTFTVAYAPSGTGFTSISYNSVGGYYVKVGQVVTVWFDIRTSELTLGPATGNLRITGFPFAPNYSAASDASAFGLASNFASGGAALGIWIQSGATTAYVISRPVATSGTSVNEVAVSTMQTGTFANQNSIEITFSYIVV